MDQSRGRRGQRRDSGGRVARGRWRCARRDRLCPVDSNASQRRTFRSGAGNRLDGPGAPADGANKGQAQAITAQAPWRVRDKVRPGAGGHRDSSAVAGLAGGVGGGGSRRGNKRSNRRSNRRASAAATTAHAPPSGGGRPPHAYFCDRIQAASFAPSSADTWGLAGIGIWPQVPTPPSRIFLASLPAASGSPAYLLATSL